MGVAYPSYTFRPGSPDHPGSLGSPPHRRRLHHTLPRGLPHLLRCARLPAGLLPRRGSFGLLLGWMVLLAFVALRLARTLDLLG